MSPSTRTPKPRKRNIHVAFSNSNQGSPASASTLPNEVIDVDATNEHALTSTRAQQPPKKRFRQGYHRTRKSSPDRGCSKPTSIVINFDAPEEQSPQIVPKTCDDSIPAESHPQSARLFAKFDNPGTNGNGPAKKRESCRDVKAILQATETRFGRPFPVSEKLNWKPWREALLKKAGDDSRNGYKLGDNPHVVDADTLPASRRKQDPEVQVVSNSASVEEEFTRPFQHNLIGTSKPAKMQPQYKVHGQAGVDGVGKKSRQGESAEVAAENEPAQHIEVELGLSNSNTEKVGTSRHYVSAVEEVEIVSVQLPGAKPEILEKTVEQAAVVRNDESGDVQVLEKEGVPEGVSLPIVRVASLGNPTVEDECGSSLRAVEENEEAYPYATF